MSAGALLLQSRQLHQLPSADGRNFSCLQELLLKGDDDARMFHGADASVYDVAMVNDMTSLYAKDGHEDLVTRFMNSVVLKIYHNVVGHRIGKQIHVKEPFTGEKHKVPGYYYSDRIVVAVVDSLSTLLASLLPTLASLALFFMNSQLSRMGAIIGFTFFFSVMLMLITRVKRAECFAITAAFSAVLLVFVGNNNGVGCSC